MKKKRPKATARAKTYAPAPVAEGDVFLVPLRNGGFARGVLARYHAPLGLGYFFGPKIASPVETSLAQLHPGDELLVGRFGDLGLLNGEWKVIGSVRPWVRTEWPLPAFGRVIEDGQEPPAMISWYDDDTLKFVREEPTTPSVARRMTPDVTMGYGSVEIRLTKILG
jgi:hypothetical protein